MRKENMKFVQDTDVPITTTLTLTEKVHLNIIESKDGRTAGELLKEFSNYNPRSIRYATQELKMKELITSDIKCRCHSTTIYYGVNNS